MAKTIRTQEIAMPDGSNRRIVNEIDFTSMYLGKGYTIIDERSRLEYNARHDGLASAPPMSTAQSEPESAESPDDLSDSQQGEGGSDSASDDLGEDLSDSNDGPD